MVELKLGGATITRIEESYEPNFEAQKFFANWNADVVREHGAWLSPNHYDGASGFLKLSVHSWLIKIGGKNILIDSCVGNHKPRAYRPKWAAASRRASTAISNRAFPEGGNRDL